MSQELFPKEIIENSQESNFSTHSVQSKIIYSTIVSSLIVLIGALPFINVDVGIHSKGMIRPVTEVQKITSPVSAKIVSLSASENSYVRKGEIIAKLDDTEIKDRLRFNQSRQSQLESYVSDIEWLKDNASEITDVRLNLNTERYMRTGLEFRQQMLNQKQAIIQLKREFEREKTLYNRNATSLLKLEEKEYLLKVEENKYKLLLDQQQNAWSLDIATFQDEIQQLLSEFSQLKNELKRYKIISPLSGTLQNSNGISENSFIYTNQVLAEISPDTTLIAEVYVPPNDIGLLKENMSVRLQIDAYDHNQWGTASGKIESISTDMILSENTPVFKVRSSIDQAFLELPNGFKGEIKKGMTFQARFIISRRSLFQLLYDNIDDWLNPAWSDTQDKTVPSNI
ncbi:MAG: HlyD family efflux transporter periplasmic adaptor subunit [Bacteroidetes bacterium]|jgi:HlyD family secretion protein|nr:HlyD family efflux transporter periplasmic adaptor subunit [Bacteroidota bacterium]